MMKSTPTAPQKQHSFTCPKCGSGSYKKGELRAAGSFWTKVFNVQNQKYISISCEQCGYTEFYKRTSSTAGSVFDFLMG